MIKSVFILFLALAVASFATAQRANFNGITDGQQICGTTGSIDLGADLDSSGTFSGPGVLDNGDGTASIDLAIMGAGTHPVMYEVFHDFEEVSAGEDHVIALKADGSLWGWGFNLFGQIGQGWSTGSGPATNITVPTQIGTDTDWVTISAQKGTSAAIKSNGTLWTWGQNNQGQIGDGTVINRLVPTQVGSATDWADVYCGNSYTLAQKTDGSLWAWGWNLNGNLGDGTTTDRLVPIQVGTATDWADFAGSGAYSVAIKNNGTLWAWGFGTANVPTQVGSDTDWMRVESTNGTHFALKTDGSLWTWGNNQFGQLGNGTTTNTTTPAQVGIASWSDVHPGTGQGIGIQIDGSLWAWGWNTHGQLGLDSYTDTLVPTRVGTANNWVDVEAGFASYAFKGNGSLWGAGRNARGNLGLGIAGSGTDTFTVFTAISGTEQEMKMLTVDEAPITTVTTTGNSLVADETNTSATYQWLDCNNNSAAISGQTSASFTPSQNGDYAVEVSLGTCVDTSSCLSFTLSNNQAVNAEQVIRLFPNPAKNRVQIESAVAIERIELMDVTGKVIQTFEQYNQNLVDVSNLPRGMYYLRFYAAGLTNTQPLVKE